MSDNEKKRRRQPPKFVFPLTPCNAAEQRCSVKRADASHRILIMRVGAYGDILMGTALLAALRQNYPQAHLTWVVEHSQVEAIDANPYLDELIVWDGSYWKRMVRLGLYPFWLIRALRFARMLHNRDYDVFISFQPEEWPLLVRGSGATVKIGVFDTFRRYYRAKKSSRYTRFYTHSFTWPELPSHRIDQYLLPLKALELPAPRTPMMSMGYTRQDDDFVAGYLKSHGILPRQPYIVLVPGTTWPTKCWPAERFAQLADRMAADHRVPVVLIGSAKEKGLLEQVAALMQDTPLLLPGTFAFRQAAALIAGAKLVVSGDTGPMHVAAAVGTPYLALFGPTSPQWYAPLSGRGECLAHSVPCGPCDQKICPNKEDDNMLCMHLISVDEVMLAAANLMRPADFQKVIL